MNNIIFEKIQEIIVKLHAINKSDIKPETLFLEDLDFDSLDNIELVMEIETVFKISIVDDDAGKLKTVEDLADHILKETNQ